MIFFQTITDATTDDTTGRGGMTKGLRIRSRFRRFKRRHPRILLAARLLMGQSPSLALFNEAGAVAASEARPISDTRGSADYRRHLVAVLTRRALAECATALECSLT